MYHYLKWAAVSLFFRRNIRYIVLIVICVAVIYFANSIYQDLVDYEIAMGTKHNILYLLIGKWVAILLSFGGLFYGVSKLGFSKDKKKNKNKKKSSKRIKPILKSKKINFSIPKNPLKREDNSSSIDERLEKFKGNRKLRSRADFILEKKSRLK